MIAAIDSSPAARSVLATAKTIARLFGATLEALHVRVDGDTTARAAAEAAGVPLRTATGSTVESLVAAAQAADVRVMVLGARGTPAGRRPAGRTALEVVTTLRKPLVVVPPDASCPARLERVLVPLDGTRPTSEALRSTIELACGSDVEVVVLHVHDDASLPAFEDQLQHETRAWQQEFLARHCPAAVRLELRVGVPREHVLRVAHEAGADLIALGWSQDLSPGRAEVVREVLERSRIPVLLVPVPAE